VGPKGNDNNGLLWDAAMHGLWCRFGAEENVLVVHLLEPVIALIVSPIDEDRTVIDGRTMIAPAFQANMGLGQRRDGRTRPGKIALGSIGSEKDGFVTAAIAFTRLALACVTHIVDTDRPDEIEVRSADIDVGSVLDQVQCGTVWLGQGADGFRAEDHGQEGASVLGITVRKALEQGRHA